MKVCRKAVRFWHHFTINYVRGGENMKAVEQFIAALENATLSTVTRT